MEESSYSISKNTEGGIKQTEDLLIYLGSIAYARYAGNMACDGVKATGKEQTFGEEVTRGTCERGRAQRFGTLLSDIRPSFAS